MEESQNSKYKSINDKLISYESKINIINNSLNSILLAISNLRKENATLKNELSSLHSKITILESSSNVNCTLPSEEVINEAQDRLVKSKNIIVFNILELPNESDNTSLTVAKDLMSDIVLGLNIVRAKRIDIGRSGFYFQNLMMLMNQDYY
jgi:chromosome segregation ATPase